MLESDNIDNEICSICMDIVNNPTLTSCGHLFCYECLKLCLDKKKKCPLCVTNIEGKDILIVNNNSNNLDNPLINKYGSKLGKLITIINTIINIKDTRIIIFLNGMIC